MATSEVDICNTALLKLGSRMITSLLDDSNQARVANQLYRHVRDACLRLHPWNCAKDRVELNQLVTDPAFGFDFQYQLPANNLRVLTLNEIPISRVDLTNTSDTIVYFGPVRFKIEGRLLLTDEDTAKITYIKRVVDVTQYDALLADLIATRLAAEAAFAITKNLKVEKARWDEYAGKIPDSRTVDGMEEYHETTEADEINYVRR